MVAHVWPMWNLEDPFGIVGHRRPGALDVRAGRLVDVDLPGILLDSRPD